MEYIKKEELIKGEIYNSTKYNHIFKYLDKNGDKNTTISKVSSCFYKDTATIGNGLDNIINATPEEKHWLNTCIENDKFIEFEEAMKTFIPEYVECIKLPNSSNLEMYSGNILGKIYKVNNWIHSNSDCTLVGEMCGSCNRNRFKPSTKEAYDAQFVVKESEFVLPEKWCMKVTNENRDIINKLRNKIQRVNIPVEYIYVTSIGYAGNYTIYGTELTFEQFKKYVLKEEIVEEKVIEPLPQFKVIETIETITKVENNEGNQFFIGDTVKSELNHSHKIKSFKYNNDKTEIFAINEFEVAFNINKIEHYIEPKVEFILPEKWCIEVTNESRPYIKKYRKSIDYKPYEIGDYKYQTEKCGDYNIKGKEITLDQFKKYVLKEDKPIIIAESHKDMLDLKAKSIDSIVLHQETLLDKAKRLYPTGTIIKSALFKTQDTIKSDIFKETIHTYTGKVIYADNGNTAIYSEQKDKWAEIIEYPHGFKVGDKIKLGEYAIAILEITKIEGNVLFFKHENGYENNHTRVLAKNAIKVN